ncbi:hypothetical protein H4R35_001119 [Dimargaris xerosporica]|nr:hypothetical protein H4R35_001119 [Dimargaris xerosporica]
MSRGGRIALATSLVFSAAVIYGVHYMQWKERETMHYGVIKDDERMQRKRQNKAELDAQRKLQAELEKEQPVSRPAV